MPPLTEMGYRLTFTLDPLRVQVLVDHPRLAGTKAIHQRILTRYYDSGDLDLERLGLRLAVRWREGHWCQSLEEAQTGVILTEALVEGPEPDRTKLTIRGKLARRLNRALDGKALVSHVQLEEERSRRVLEPDLEVTLSRQHIEAAGRRESLIRLEITAARFGEVLALARQLARQAPLLQQEERGGERGFGWLTGRWPSFYKARPLALETDLDAEQAFGVIVASCLKQVRANLVAVLDGQPEGVHQLRVALRRLRAALKAFRPLIPKQASETLVGEVRWISGLLGPCRDWDVFIEEGLKPIAGHFPQRRGLKNLLDRARSLRGGHYRQLYQALTTSRYHLMILDWQVWLAERAWREYCTESQGKILAAPARDFALRVLKRAYRRVVEEGERFGELTVVERHDLRIRIKELRYALEFFSCLFDPKAAGRMAKASSQLQDSLGILNDIAVAKRLLEEAGTAPNNATRALVEGWYGCKAAMLVGRFPDGWSAFIGQQPFWKGESPA
ncbi:MAG: CHAD domain-containing protein [Candidatus Competibacteraceae bacterium]|nr:CHAD domain-containing protein [Candidatus Competibacteraceae bacterium]